MNNKYIITVYQDKAIVNAMEIQSRDLSSAQNYALNIMHTIYLDSGLRVEVKRV